METTRVQNIIFFTVLVLVTILFLYLLKPFFFPIFWAAVIAGIFKPLFARMDGKLKSPTLSSALVLTIIILILILPGGIIGSLLLAESIEIYNSLGAARSGDIEKKIAHITAVIASYPQLAGLDMSETFLTERFTEIARGISNYLLVNLKNLTQNTLLFIVQFAVMLYTLFFFIRDGERFLEMVMRLFTFGGERERILYDRFVATARSTLKVTLIIGGLQGILGGILFYITGIDGAIVWGVVMILLAIVPVVGCSIIWAPAGAIMLLAGNIWQGALILAVGFFVISSVDNFLRPVLLGKDVQMHPLLIFLSSLGGLSLFGLSGFVIGPIIASLLLAVWAMYDQFYRDRLS